VLTCLFEVVVLAARELKALKVLQAKMQREAPQHTHVVQQWSRQMVYQVTGAAIVHVYQARLDRQARAQ
jgi:hypothetical protein